ncbi:hypothetical protein GGI00_004218, partial [Coemansia sp. RSA 2681]
SGGGGSSVFADSYQLPVRRFLVQASLCRTELEIGQKSINVGNMQVDEASRKYLVIKNQTETPLMYAIRKTGSIASGDIQFVDNNRYGVVRGFDSRKIVFVFTPSLTGTYSEQISIANVLDAQGGKTATLKAVVRRPSKFYIQSLLLEFGKQGERGKDEEEEAEEERGLEAATADTTGLYAASPRRALQVGKRSDEAQLLVIKNMTGKTRQFVVKSIKDMQAESLPTPLKAAVKDKDKSKSKGKLAMAASQIDDGASETSVVLDPLFPADVTTLTQSAKVLDRETEEKIEALEQKLKIAARKNRPEKVEKYTSKLAKLRGAVSSEVSSAAGASASTSVGDHLAKRSPPSAAGQPLVTVQRLAADTQLLVTLPGNSDASIPVVVIPRMVAVATVATATTTSMADKQQHGVVLAKGQFVVHEDKDKDNVKIVTLQAAVEVGGGNERHEGEG